MKQSTKKQIEKYFKKRYPQVYYENGYLKPLSVGIHKQIMAREVVLSNTQIRKLLHYITNHISYQVALRKSERRYNLDGEIDMTENGEITEEQRARAKEWINIKKGLQPQDKT